MSGFENEAVSDLSLEEAERWGAENVSPKGCELWAVSGDRTPVFGDVWPSGGGFHVRVCGVTPSWTLRPVVRSVVAFQVEQFVRRWGYRLSEVKVGPPVARAADGSPLETVYFIRDRRGPVKIGRTSSGNASARLEQLQTGNPYPLELLATTRKHAEGELHARFAATRLLGEWFEPTPDLLALIQACREDEDA